MGPNKIKETGKNMSKEKEHNNAIDIPISNILDAAEHVRRIHGITPIMPMETIVRDGIVIYVHGKFENVQNMYTFKVRGSEWFVYNEMNLYHEGKGKYKKDKTKPELVTASAGNHAQGVALAANRYGLIATIFMPESTPEVKKRRVQELGANVQLVGASFDEALSAALKYKQENRNRLFVPPYENPMVMEGQATIGVEILSQACPIHHEYWRVADYKWDVPDVIISGLGGGGLISGIGAVVKDFNKKSGSNIKVIGVQTELADSMYSSFKQDKLINNLHDKKSLADGIAVKKATERMRMTVKKFVDQVVVVSEDNIKKSISYIYNHPLLKNDIWETKERWEPSVPYRQLPKKQLVYHQKRPLNVVEGAAAAAYAAVIFGDLFNELDWKKIANGKKKLKVIVVLTGGNIAEDKLKEINSEIQRPRDL